MPIERFLFQCRGNAGEGCVELRSERCDHGDNRNRNPRGDEAVFNGGCPRVLLVGEVRRRPTRSRRDNVLLFTEQPALEGFE